MNFERRKTRIGRVRRGDPLLVSQKRDKIPGEAVPTGFFYVQKRKRRLLFFIARTKNKNSKKKGVNVPLEIRGRSPPISFLGKDNETKRRLLRKSSKLHEAGA